MKGITSMRYFVRYLHTCQPTSHLTWLCNSVISFSQKIHIYVHLLPLLCKGFNVLWYISHVMIYEWFSMMTWLAKIEDFVCTIGTNIDDVCIPVCSNVFVTEITMRLLVE